MGENKDFVFLKKQSQKKTTADSLIFVKIIDIYYADTPVMEQQMFLADLHPSYSRQEAWRGRIRWGFERPVHPGDSRGL